MTFGEIYSNVCFNIWGNSAVPAGAATRLQGDEGIISRCHKIIQQEYNYWFMHTWYETTAVIGTQSYPLPATFKELIAVQFKKNGEAYFLPPLAIVDDIQAHAGLWTDNSTAEYPTYAQLADESIILYPTPSAAREFHIIYYKIFASPTTAGFTAAYDDVTNRAGDAIAALATVRMARILKEWDIAEQWSEEYQEEVSRLQEEDRRRRQSSLYEVKYSGC